MLGKSLNPVGVDIVKDAERALEAALADAHVPRSEVGFITGTGYGRYKVYFGQLVVTEISCHARGANFLFPGTRLVIDIGGQDTKAIRINEKGEVVDFAMNDKCAAGTGRFLDVCANALGFDVAQIGPLSLQARRAVKVTSTCTVFAESEVTSYVARGKEPKDILAGLHASIAEPYALPDATGRRGTGDHLHRRSIPERRDGPGPPAEARSPGQCEPALPVPGRARGRVARTGPSRGGCDMITVGLDLGAGVIKGAMLENGRRILATASTPSRGIPVQAARTLLEELGETANLAPGEVDYLCTTGFGRVLDPRTEPSGQRLHVVGPRRDLPLSPDPTRRRYRDPGLPDDVRFSDRERS